jgi:IPTL-CTERM motif
MKIFAPAVAAVATALWVSLASAITISDPTDWASGWVYSTVEVAGAGTASFTVEPAGGNPGARLNSTTVTPTGADTAFGAALYQAVTVVAPLSGTAFVMRLDVLSGPGGFGQGQAVQALVGQGGSLYQTPLGITGFPLNSFTTLTFNGTFTAGAFTKVSGPGPATPSFDGVTPTSFGFAVGNNMSATLTQYYDNWNITVTLPGPVGNVVIPTLSNGSLLLLTALVALAGFAAWRRRR